MELIASNHPIFYDFMIGATFIWMHICFIYASNTNRTIFTLLTVTFYIQYMGIFSWNEISMTFLSLLVSNCHTTVTSACSVQAYLNSNIRSGAAADRRTPLKPGAQLDLASPYAVPRARRTKSPTSLNYAKLCVELNYTGAAIGEMWGDLVIRHIVLE